MLGTAATATNRPTRPKLPPIPSPKQPPPPYTPSAASVQPPPAAHARAKVTPLPIANHEPHKDTQLPSPARTTSFRPPLATPNGKTATAYNKKLPRLMTVVSTYVPSLSDELQIKVGESVRMLEEYEDEWCLVQYVGRTNDKKGVCPRLCLVERQDIIPRQRKGVSIHFPISTASYVVSTYYK